MLRKIANLGICLVLVSLVLVSTCDKQVTGSNDDVMPMTALTKNQINWISPTAEYAAKLDELAKTGHAGGWISPEKGGFVGGTTTFGNYVYFPEGAVQSWTYFTVDAVKEESDGVKTLSYEFLPSMTFEQPVTVCLSWSFLDISYEDIQNGNFQIYYSQDDENWYPIDKSTLAINYYAKTVSFQTDHFTRYGWGF